MLFVHQRVLTAVLQQVGRGQDVLLVGDAGSGRSSVLRGLAEPLRLSGFSVVELPGTATADGVPLAGFLTHSLLRPRTGVRWGVADATTALIDALGERRGVVLVDDIELLDTASLAVLAAVARQYPARVRLVASAPHAPVGEAAWGAVLRDAAIQRVPPLGVSDVASLLADVLEGPVEGGLAAVVTGRSGGIPAVARHLALAALDSGAIDRVRGRWAQTGTLDDVPVDAVAHGLLVGLSDEARHGLETLAWFGLLDIERARELLGDDLVELLDREGRLVVHERQGRPGRRALAVSPPMLGYALRLGLTPARRALLEARAGELLGTGTPGPADPHLTAPSAAADDASPRDEQVNQQVTILTESVRTRALLWRRTWSQRHDVASALPLVRLHLLDGLTSIDVDSVFAATAASEDDDPEEVASYVLLRSQWVAHRGGSARDGLCIDPGPTGRLVLDPAAEPLVALLAAPHAGEPVRGVDALTDDVVPAGWQGCAALLRVVAALNAGESDRALDLLGEWQPSSLDRPFGVQLDALRGEALLMAGQVDDAASWARRRLSEAYDELSPFAVRLAARGLASALFVAGDHEASLRALSVVLRLGRCGPVQSPYDERIFGLAAVLHARLGNHMLARTLLDELDATPRPYVPVLDFMRPWARMEVERASRDGAPSSAEALWQAGEDRWEQGRRAAALACWALTPKQLSSSRLQRLEEAFAAADVRVLAPLVRVHRELVDGSGDGLADVARSLRSGGPLQRLALEVAAERTGNPELTADADPGGPLLTTREREVVALARDGLTNREIASELYLSVRTVESHLYRAMQKLGVSDRHLLGVPVRE